MDVRKTLADIRAMRLTLTCDQVGKLLLITLRDNFLTLIKLFAASFASFAFFLSKLCDN